MPGVVTSLELVVGDVGEPESGVSEAVVGFEVGENGMVKYESPIE
jgi:hypothetical protein